MAQLTVIYMNDPDADVAVTVLRDAYSVTDSILLKTAKVCPETNKFVDGHTIFLGKVYNERMRISVSK